MKILFDILYIHEKIQVLMAEKRVVMMQSFSSLMPRQVVIMTTCCLPCDTKIGIMTMVGFQCITLRVWISASHVFGVLTVPMSPYGPMLLLVISLMYLRNLL